MMKHVIPENIWFIIILSVNNSKADKTQVQATFVASMVKSNHICINMAKIFNFMFKDHRQILLF